MSIFQIFHNIRKYGILAVVLSFFTAYGGSAFAIGFDISASTLESDATTLVAQAVAIALAVGVAVVGLVIGMHILKVLRGSA